MSDIELIREILYVWCPKCKEEHTICIYNKGESFTDKLKNFICKKCGYKEGQDE